MFDRILPRGFTRILFTALAVSIIALSVFTTAIFLFYQSRDEKADLIEHGQMFADILSQTSRTGIFLENEEILKESVAGLGAQNHVTAIWIYSAGGQPLFVWGEGILASVSGKKDDGPLKSAQGELLAVIHDDSSIYFQAPVFIDSYEDISGLRFPEEKSFRTKRLIGFVKIQMDTSHMGKVIIQMLLKDLTAVAIILLTGFTFLYYTLVRATQPLRVLTESIKAYGRGEPAAQMPVESDDEIGNLAQAFNQMTKDLKRRQEEAVAFEERLKQSRRMEAIGTLARGISHDFKNILTTIQGAVYLIEKKTGNDGEMMSVSAKIHSAIGKSRELIDALVAFSKTQRIMLREVDIVYLIKKSAPLLQEILGKDKDLIMNLPENKLIVMADRIQIERVLINLSANAADAMPGKGVLTITAGESELPEHLHRIIEHKEGKTPPGYAEIKVADTGTGFDSATREKIFEPFFTTKESGKGTGLGLSIVYGIIEQHGGCIDVQSEVGNGTAFSIFLPLAEKPGNEITE